MSDEKTGAMNLVKRYEFDRLPRESVKAFTAFRAYLDMGPQRSLAALAKKLGKSKVLMERWSRRHDWTGRVAAHVGYVAQVEREAIEGLAPERAIEWEEVHEDQRISQWNARSRAVKLAEEMIERWEGTPKRCGTLEGIARLLELASGTEVPGEREGMGAPAVRVEVSLALEKILLGVSPTGCEVPFEAPWKPGGPSQG